MESKNSQGSNMYHLNVVQVIFLLSLSLQGCMGPITEKQTCLRFWGCCHKYILFSFCILNGYNCNLFSISKKDLCEIFYCYTHPLWLCRTAKDIINSHLSFLSFEIQSISMQLQFRQAARQRFQSALPSLGPHCLKAAIQRCVTLYCLNLPGRCCRGETSYFHIITFVLICFCKYFRNTNASRSDTF